MIKRLQKHILWLPVIAWMTVIFLYSAQDGVESYTSSDKAIKSASELFKSINLQGLSEFLYAYIAQFVRKIAHFAAYFGIGVLSMLALLPYRIHIKKQVLISFVIGFLFACSDEIHQLFVPGRNGSLRDVLIDSLGLCLAIAVFVLILRNVRKKAVM